MKLLVLFFTILIFIGSFVGCNYSILTTGNNADLDYKMKMSTTEQAKLSYSLINSEILQTKCIGCHGNSGGVNLETYQNIFDNLSKIKTSVFSKKTMPKNNSLTAEQEKMLWNWIELNAPEYAQTPENEPQSEPLTPTYSSIYKNIFAPKCISCHSPGNQAERVPLDKEELLDSPLELVLPNNPDESGLVIAVERTDRKRMPPEKEGYAPLKDEEKSAIRKWIADGAIN